MNITLISQTLIYIYILCLIFKRKVTKSFLQLFGYGSLTLRFIALIRFQNLKKRHGRCKNIIRTAIASKRCYKSVVDHFFYLYINRLQTTYNDHLALDINYSILGQVHCYHTFIPKQQIGIEFMLDTTRITTVIIKIYTDRVHQVLRQSTNQFCIHISLQRSITFQVFMYVPIWDFGRDCTTDFDNIASRCPDKVFRDDKLFRN